MLEIRAVRSLFSDGYESRRRAASGEGATCDNDGGCSNLAEFLGNLNGLKATSRM